MNPLFFFLMVTTLFPLGTTANGSELEKLAGGVIWVAALLSVLLSLDSLFKNDYRDGTIAQLLLSPYPLSLLVLAKALAHWLRTGFVLTLVSPLLGVMLFLSLDSLFALSFSLLIGTPLLSLIGSISAALTVSITQGGVLMSLLTLPLFIPVIIFATSSIKAATQGLPYGGYLLWLGAFLALGLCLAPWAIAGALRGGVE